MSAETEKKYDSANPKECWSASNHNNETIYLLPEFIIADINGNKEKDIKGEDPGKIDGKYSKVRICILGPKIGSGYANIRYKDWPNIVKRTEYAGRLAMEYGTKIAAAKADCGGTSPAYTAVLGGSMKGKTAAQVLFEEGGQEKLRAQRDWLANNLKGKFEKANRAQIAGIDDALNLYSRGALNRPADKPDLPVFNIYTAQFHANTYIKHETNPNLYFTFDCTINYAVGDDYPIKVEIANYYCPVTVKPGGQQIVHADKKEFVDKYTYSLSEADWDHALTKVQERRDIFLYCNASQITKNITTVAIANAENAKQKASNTANTRVSSPTMAYNSQRCTNTHPGTTGAVPGANKGPVATSATTSRPASKQVQNITIETCGKFEEHGDFLKVPVRTTISDTPMKLLFRKSEIGKITWFNKFRSKADSDCATQMVINGEVAQNCILFGSVGTKAAS